MSTLELDWGDQQEFGYVLQNNQENCGDDKNKKRQLARKLSFFFSWTGSQLPGVRKSSQYLALPCPSNYIILPIMMDPHSDMQSDGQLQRTHVVGNLTGGQVTGRRCAVMRLVQHPNHSIPEYTSSGTSSIPSCYRFQTHAHTHGCTSLSFFRSVLFEISCLAAFQSRCGGPT